MQDQMLSCFFPTTVAFIDDENGHLSAQLEHIDKTHIIPKLFNQSADALAFINQQPSLLWQVFSDMGQFHQQIINAPLSRFQELTVIVCNYSVAEKNALDFFKEIKNPKVKTIIVTNEVNESLVVEAFNRGLIDNYVRMGQTGFIEALNRMILSLQQEYIMRATSLFVDNITIAKMPSPCMLSDPAFITLFDDIVKKHHIIEYYLLNEQGGYLLLDAKGSAYFLAVMDEATLESLTQSAIDAKTQPAITEALKTKSAIPFFYTEEDATVSPHEWLSLLHPAQVCVGQNTYYYSLIPPAQINRHMLTAQQSYQYFCTKKHFSYAEIATHHESN